jgi:hypothetical protein
VFLNHAEERVVDVRVQGDGNGHIQKISEGLGLELLELERECSKESPQVGGNSLLDIFNLGALYVGEFGHNLVGVINQKLAVRVAFLL